MFSRTRLALATTIVALALLPPFNAFAESTPHVRVFDRELKARLDEGIRRSPTLAALVDELDKAAVLVFVDCRLQLPSRVGARVQLATSINGVRYIRVDVSCFLPDAAKITLLAHEFQHALEIAGRSDIVDSDSMESYFQDIGFQTYFDGNHKAYETEAAIAIQERVRAELRVREPAVHGHMMDAGAGY